MAVSAAAWALMANPLFWKAALIAAGIALIALAIEDIYYWITDGESVLGDWLGTWEEFKNKVMSWIASIRDGLVDIIDKMVKALGLTGAYEKWRSSTKHTRRC